MALSCGMMQSLVTGLFPLRCQKIAIYINFRSTLKVWYGINFNSRGNLIERENCILWFLPDDYFPWLFLSSLCNVTLSTTQSPSSSLNIKLVFLRLYLARTTTASVCPALSSPSPSLAFLDLYTLHEHPARATTTSGSRDCHDRVHYHYIGRHYRLAVSAPHRVARRARTRWRNSGVGMERGAAAEVAAMRRSRTWSRLRVRPFW